jgi:plasmid stabilization system protein ParE
MPQGDKSKYTDKQKRQATDIEKSYEKRGVSKATAEMRAWATVNKMSGGGKKSGSGRGKPVNKGPAKKGGRSHASRTAAPVAGSHEPAGGKKGGAAPKRASRAKK